MKADQHSSRRTRVEPVFRWLKEHGSADWASDLLRLADGIEATGDVGKVVSVAVGKERTVPASAQRLAWMIQNATRLAPRIGRRWSEYERRVTNNPQREQALRRLKLGRTNGIPRELKLEGPTHADCLIECERSLVWIEGKRNDWLSPCTTWDVTRDQLARDLEGAWLVATPLRKDFWLLVCHENDLKHHELELVNGYRAGTWKAGLPHLSEDVRQFFRKKIGTVTWKTILGRWPGAKRELHDRAGK
jgi:hypothetical protein